MAGRTRRWTSGLLAVLVVASGLALAQAPVAADEPAPGTYPQGEDRTPPPFPKPERVDGTADVNPVTVGADRGNPSAAWSAGPIAAGVGRLPAETDLGPSLVNSWPSYCYVTPARTLRRVDCHGTAPATVCLYERPYFVSTVDARVLGACPGDPGAYDPPGCMTLGNGFRVVACETSSDPVGDMPAPFPGRCVNHERDPAWTKSRTCKSVIGLSVRSTSSQKELHAGEPHEFAVGLTSSPAPLTAPATVTVTVANRQTGVTRTQKHRTTGGSVVFSEMVTGDLTITASVPEDDDVLGASATATFGTLPRLTMTQRGRTVTFRVLPAEVRTLVVDATRFEPFQERLVRPRSQEERWVARRTLRRKKSICAGRSPRARAVRCLKRVRREYRLSLRPEVSYYTNYAQRHLSTRRLTTNASGTLTATFAAPPVGVPLDDYFVHTGVLRNDSGDATVNFQIRR